MFQQVIIVYRESGVITQGEVSLQVLQKIHSIESLLEFFCGGGWYVKMITSCGGGSGGFVPDSFKISKSPNLQYNPGCPAQNHPK